MGSESQIHTILKTVLSHCTTTGIRSTGRPPWQILRLVAFIIEVKKTNIKIKIKSLFYKY